MLFGVDLVINLYCKFWVTKKNNFKKFFLYAKRGEKMVLYKMLYQKQKCIKWEDKNQEQQIESSYMEDLNQLFQ